MRICAQTNPVDRLRASSRRRFHLGENYIRFAANACAVSAGVVLTVQQKCPANELGETVRPKWAASAPASGQTGLQRMGKRGFLPSIYIGRRRVKSPTKNRGIWP